MRCAFGIGQIDFELRSHVYVPNRQRVDRRVEKCAGILQEQWFVAGRFKRRVERQRDEDRDVPVSDDLILEECRLSLRPTTWNGTVNGGRALMILFAGLAFLPPANATQPTAVQTEIGFLLTYVGTSGCDFYRNGRWYDSKRAEAHLRSKYATISAGGGIDTAEDFIEKAATKSSFSGRAYEVRCTGAAIESSHDWLTEALSQYRRSPQADPPESERNEGPSESSAHL